MSSPPLYISGPEVRGLVSMTDLMEAMRPAFQWFSTGRVVQPLRTTTQFQVNNQDQNGRLLSMVAYSSDAESLAVKLLTYFPENMSIHNIQNLQGIVLLLDSTTGSMRAMIDGVVVTDIRTAAASACAIKVLTLTTPPKTLCIVGSGVQARSHLEALTETISYTRVILWGRNRSHAEQCVREVGVEGVEVCDSLEEAVRDADVIVTVTMPKEPVLYGKWCKPGAVICSVGASRPDRRELDDELMHNSVVIVDTREGALKESGDIIIPQAEIYAELGEIIAGTKTLPTVPGCGKKFIVFKSVGMAVEDVVSAKLIYDKYIQKRDNKQ